MEEDEFLARARAIGSVTSAALARSLPFSTRPYDNGPIQVDGYAPQRDERPTAEYNAVSPDYFHTLGIPVISGRDFATSDADTSAPVAIVSRALAQRYWPNVSPIGKRLRLRDTWMRVVGVVGDIKYRALTEGPGMLFYVPLAQRRQTSVDVFLRTAQGGATPSVARSIVREMHAIDPNVSPYEILTLREQVNRWTSGQQIMVTLLILFGAVALLLAAIGLYGTISYMVAQGTRELGVRMALGATPPQLLILVVSSGLRLTMIGVGLGVALVLGTTRLLGDLLYGVGPRDPLVITGVVAIMGVVATLACLVPGWRASQLDPTRALRV